MKKNSVKNTLGLCVIILFGLVFVVSPVFAVDDTCQCSIVMTSTDNTCAGASNDNIDFLSTLDVENIINGASFATTCSKSNIIAEIDKLGKKNIMIADSVECTKAKFNITEGSTTAILSCVVMKGQSATGATTSTKASASKTKTATCGDGKVCLENPIGTTDIPTIMGNIVAQALKIMGSLALLVFIVGGFMWMTAAGNPEKVKKGTEAMMWATIGIIVIFSSYAIIKLVLQGIGAV